MKFCSTLFTIGILFVLGGVADAQYINDKADYVCTYKTLEGKTLPEFEHYLSVQDQTFVSRIGEAFSITALDKKPRIYYTHTGISDGAIQWMYEEEAKKGDPEGFRRSTQFHLNRKTSEVTVRSIKPEGTNEATGKCVPRKK